MAEHREPGRTNKRLEPEVAAKLLRSLATHRFSQVDRDPHQVFDGLFIGSIGAANNAAALCRNGIDHVITLCSEKVDLPSGVTQLLLDDVADRADSDLASRLVDCCAFISAALARDARNARGSEVKSLNRAAPDDLPHCADIVGRHLGGDRGDTVEEDVGQRRGGVLVHCFQGKSRSAAVVAAFLIWHARGLVVDARKVDAKAVRARKVRELSLFANLWNAKAGCYGTSGGKASKFLTSLVVMRSRGVVWAYRIGLAEAMERVRKARPCAAPNLGFVAQLRRWERSCHAERDATATRLLPPPLLPARPVRDKLGD